MIASVDVGASEPPVWIDLVRPDLFTDEDLARWKRIHDCVKTCELSIAVNGMFAAVDKMIENKELYGGGGFAYNFWFQTVEDRSAFIQLLVNTCGITPHQIANCKMHPAPPGLTTIRRN